LEKIIKVENIGTNPAYLRTCIAVPNGYTAQWPDAYKNTRWITVDYRQDDAWSWCVYTDVPVHDTLCDVYVITYKDPLPAGKTTADNILKYQISAATDFVDGRYSLVVDGQVLPVELPEELRIWVATEAVQTTTFTDAEQAFETVFGSVADGKTPWSWENSSDPMDEDTYIPNTVIYGETTAP